LPHFLRKSFLRRINPTDLDRNKEKSRHNPDASGVSERGTKAEMFRPAFRTLAILIATTISALSGLAQTPQPSPAASVPSFKNVIGEVKSIDGTAKQVIVRADSGTLTTVNLSEKAQYLRVAPGEKSLTNATNITLADVGEGDRVLAQGRPSADGKSLSGLRLVVMTKADIAKKHDQERADWRRRGVLGMVASVNPAAKEVTITSRTLMGTSQSVIIPITDKVMIRRYPPDSIPKFSEAKPSKFEELKAGDQVRALGDKSADGTHLTAEEVVFGSFRLVGGTVTAIDAATGEVKISDLKSKQPLTIVIKSDSVLRRFPENFGAMLGGGGPGPGAPPQGGAKPSQAQGQGQGQSQGQGQGQSQGQGQAARAQGSQGQGGGAGAPQGGGMRMGGGNMTMAEMLERLPTISINELKVGDMVVMSSIQGTDPTRVTAISLVTGVEPLLTMMAARQQAGGQPRPATADLNSSFGGMFGGMGLP
jgi:co-chaperonin GroES (HSP10)